MNSIRNRTSIWKPLWQIICYRLDLSLIDAILWIVFALIPVLPGLIIREFFDTLTDNTSLSFSPWVLIALLLAVGLAQLACLFAARVISTQYRFTWLRWCDDQGNILLTGDEKAEQERQRAEQEHQRAERLAAILKAQGIDPEQLPET